MPKSKVKVKTNIATKSAALAEAYNIDLGLALELGIHTIVQLKIRQARRRALYEARRTLLEKWMEGFSGKEPSDDVHS